MEEQKPTKDFFKAVKREPADNFQPNSLGVLANYEVFPNEQVTNEAGYSNEQSSSDWYRDMPVLREEISYTTLKNVKMEPETDFEFPRTFSGETSSSTNHVEIKQSYNNLYEESDEDEQDICLEKTEPQDSKSETVSDIEEDYEPPEKKSFAEKTSGRRRRCKVCLEFFDRDHVKNVTLKEERQLIVIGRFLQGTLNIDGPEFVESKHGVLVCRSHFEETLTEIRNALKIRNVSEIDSCSQESIHEFMMIVHCLFPEMSFDQFSFDFKAFWKRNRTPELRHESSDDRHHSELHEWESHFSCDVCEMLIERKNTKSVTMKEEKRMLVIGSFLEGNEMDSAKIESKRAWNVCHSHFQDTLSTIYQKSLHIKNFSEIGLCSLEASQELMKTVHSLFPLLTSQLFVVSLYNFEKRNRHLITEITPLQPEKNEKSYRATCKVCFHLSQRSQLKFVTMIEEKQLIMIGCVLRGNFTKKHAKDFLKCPKNKLVCIIHLVEVLIDICKSLQIDKPSDLPTTPLKSREVLMKTVTSISPKITFEELSDSINQYLKRNQNLILGIATDNAQDENTQEATAFIRKIFSN